MALLTQKPSSNGCKVIYPQSWQSKRFLDLLCSRLHFSLLYTELLLFERPGFDSRSAQTLKACNFEALWSGKTYSTSFERSKLYLLGQMEKKRFGAFLKHFSLAQNTLKSYHKRPKSRFNLQGTVLSLHKASRLS